MSLARAITFFTVTLLWVWFRAANVADAWRMCRSMLGVKGLGVNGMTLAPMPPQTMLALMTAALLVAWLAPNSQKLFDRPVIAPAWRVALGILLAVSIASLQHASEFLYFNF